MNQKRTKKPFILKINRVAIQKRVLELPKSKIVRKSFETQEKITALRNRLLSQNKPLLIRHFFSQWKKEVKYENNTILGNKSLKVVLGKYMVRCLIMYAKFLKFKKILIKYALNHKKK